MPENETTKETTDFQTKIANVEKFERSFGDHILLAAFILAGVRENYTRAQLDDIGRRARHWVMHAYRLYLEKEAQLSL
jgi:hypothetical protein